MLYIYLLWWNILTFILFILLTNVISFQFKESLPFYFPLVYLFTGGKLLSFYLSGKFILLLLTLNWWPCWVENYWLEVLFCFFIYFMTLALLFFSQHFIYVMLLLYGLCVFCLDNLLIALCGFSCILQVVFPLAVFRILFFSLNFDHFNFNGYFFGSVLIHFTLNYLYIEVCFLPRLGKFSATISLNNFYGFSLFFFLLGPIQCEC